MWGCICLMSGVNNTAAFWKIDGNPFHFTKDYYYGFKAKVDSHLVNGETWNISLMGTRS